MSTSIKNWLRVLAVGWLVGLSAVAHSQPLNPIVGPDLVCPGSQVTYQLTNIISGNTFLWTLPSGGGTIIGSQTDTMVTIQWQQSNGGPFTLLMTESDMMLGTQGNVLAVTVADDIARYPFNCLSEVNIPMDNNCEKLIEPQHLLTSGVPDCANSFEISLTLNGDIPVPNPITEAYIDEIITATIRHPESGRECSTLITLKDGNPPILTCSNDTTICNDSLAWDPFHDSFNRPTVTDNCSGDLLPQPQGYEWVKLFGDSIFSDYIIRSWDAVDKYGNRGECVDTIFLLRVIFDSIMCPPDTTISCETPGFDPEDPHSAGVPTFDGYPIYSKFSYCDIGIEYSDKITYKCPGNYRIYREWVITDVGPSHGELICNQVIDVIDTLGPSITFDSSEVSYEQHNDVFGINPDSFYKTVYFPTLDYSCFAHGYFPTPELNDFCSPSDSLIVDLSWSNGHIRYVSGDDNKHLGFENLMKGKHIISIQVADGCHNFTYDTLIAIAKDIKPPYMAVDRYPVVTLGNYAEVTWIDASVFDEGTWDNCGMNFFLARRVDWATACGVDLCDDSDLICTGEHKDSIWCARLEDDRKVNEVEAHYVNFIQWLCEDGDECSELMLSGWAYDLLKYGTTDCSGQSYAGNDDFMHRLLSDSTLCYLDSLHYLPCFKNDSLGDHTEHLHPLPSDQSQLDIAAQIGGGWSASVPFCCQDACEEVVIEVLAMDYWCNFAKNWITVQVEDKAAPEVRKRLPDLSISCYAYNHYYRDSIEQGNWDVFGTYVPYERYGSVSNTYIMDHICTDTPGPDGDYHETVLDSIANGVVLDICGLVMKETQKTHFEKCGVGWIEREFTFTGLCNEEKGDSIKVVQRINIYNDCPLRETDIIWPPKDTTFYACGIEPFETIGPKLNKEDECRDIGIHYKDVVLDELYNADSTCFKIIRKWAVIDWCRQTAAYHDDWIGDQQFHYYEYDQIIYVKDREGPVINGCDIDSLCIGSNCTASLSTAIQVTDSCSSREEIQVSWSLYRRTAFGYDLVTEADTDTAKADQLTLGTYRLIWKAKDGCNNVTYCTDFFEVLDCVKPSPICLTSTTLKLWPVDLDQNGSIDTAVGEIWAQELDVSSFDNCQNEITDFRIRLKGTGKVDGQGNLLPPDSSETKVSMGCGDIGSQLMEMWVVDDYGNADYCEVIVEVVGPIEGCSDDLGRVKGLVSSMVGAGLADVEMQVTLEDQVMAATSTSSNGQYDFGEFKLDHGTYWLTPSKVDDPIDGISTQDLIAISKHILGKEVFEATWQEEAADVNGNGAISVADLITMRKLILGKIPTLPVDEQWRFYNVDQQPRSRLQRPRYEDQLNFNGLKIGDVNGDAASSSSSQRSRADSYLIEFINKEVSAKQQVRIPLIATDALEVEGLQLHVEISGLDNIFINSTLPDFDQTMWSATHDRIRMSWIADGTHQILPGDTLATIIAVATGVDKTANMLAVRQDDLASEFYTSNNALRTIKLIEREDEPSNSVIKLTSKPNPFVNQAHITIDLASDLTGILRIVGSDGVVYLHQSKRWIMGANEVELHRNKLGAAGLYMIEFRSAHATLRDKIILLE